MFQTKQGLFIEQMFTSLLYILHEQKTSTET
jgi:hypothetical protein